MSPATEAGRRLARAAADAFGGQPRVNRYYDEPEAHAVDILACRDAPAPGYSTYSTLTLHESPNLLEGNDIRVEIAGVAESRFVEFPNVIATAAFHIIKQGWLCAPGVVFPGIMSEYDLPRALEHVLWVTPFAWEDLHSVDLADNGPVHWLLAVPISEGERQFLIERGYDELVQQFEQDDVEYFDLERAPRVAGA